jgi:hypothetical protein
MLTRGQIETFRERVKTPLCQRDHDSRMYSAHNVHHVHACVCACVRVYVYIMCSYPDPASEHVCERQTEGGCRAGSSRADRRQREVAEQAACALIVGRQYDTCERTCPQSRGICSRKNIHTQGV